MLIEGGIMGKESVDIMGGLVAIGGGIIAIFVLGNKILIDLFCDYGDSVWKVTFGKLGIPSLYKRPWYRLFWRILSISVGIFSIILGILVLLGVFPIEWNTK
jgi:uncharacterized membrane protein YphA (DoxX/SURF4 family)